MSDFVQLLASDIHFDKLLVQAQFSVQFFTTAISLTTNIQNFTNFLISKMQKQSKTALGS